ncbi:hypothetical protein CDL15_Pgr025497 [Punica granatum]|uniref:Uncharacterized protein n=1 Tax=Punica granatum TaxID=22663 RepID=A0A218WB18_PUNGR|nr:hypothetical protein CDL15_Pgr025497 [Punica granatum]PKI57674.1 hypothetical protein CRG98_022002 [Punica granatum]
MKPIDDEKETVTFRAVSHDEEGRKRVTKTEVNTHNVDTLRYIEKKLTDNGVQRQDRHPPPKSGHGGRFTWEGPANLLDNELFPAPAVLDEGDPNYVDEEEEGRILRGERSDVAGLVIGEVEVPKVEEVGVARVDIIDECHPHLQTN